MLVTFDLAAKDTIVRCRSFFSCAGVRAGKELALAAKKKKKKCQKSIVSL